MGKLKEKFNRVMGHSKATLDNERGITLIDMLVAILIFVLASVLIVTMVTKALDKPKEAGVRSVFNGYETAAQTLLLETSGNMPGDTAEDWVIELNEALDKEYQFDPIGGETYTTNAYGNVYEIDGKNGAGANKAQFVITSEGKKPGEVYTLGVYYVDGEVSTCTLGFGRNNKDIAQGVTVGNVCGATIDGIDTP